MSGYPHPKLVEDLRLCIELVSSHDAEIKRLSDVIATSRAQLETYSQARNANADKIEKLLTKMDCRQSGNNGYEHRIVALLTELHRQTIVTKEPK